MRTVRTKFLLLILILGVYVLPCSARFKNEGVAYPLQYLNRQLTNILINDNFSPPPASRVYAYTNIGTYIVLTGASGKENKLSRAIAGLPKYEAGAQPKDLSPSLTASYTFYYLSKRLIYTFKPFDDSFKVLLAWYKEGGCTDAEIENAQKVAKGYTDQFAEWMAKDNFAETRRMSEYVLDEVAGHWTPTYPGYMPGLEPHWGDMRPLVISANSVDLRKFGPLKFDTAKSSAYFKEGYGVYTNLANAPKEQLAIADFWDCNAFEIFPEGHNENVIKKMSPGGHWMNIVTIVSAQSKADILKTSLAYAMTATALFDAFICTWKMKYEYKTLRPETYLQNLGYPDFRPYLQSPPFPEYPSGHAVISMAAATVLSDIFGKSFHFVDNTEDRWDIPARSFSSFVEAAKEAGISRYYGAIHYKYSCEDGSKIGAVIGGALWKKIK